MHSDINELKYENHRLKHLLTEQAELLHRVMRNTEMKIRYQDGPNEAALKDMIPINVAVSLLADRMNVTFARSFIEPYCLHDGDKK